MISPASKEMTTSAVANDGVFPLAITFGTANVPCANRLPAACVPLSTIAQCGDLRPPGSAGGIEGHRAVLRDAAPAGGPERYCPRRSRWHPRIRSWLAPVPASVGSAVQSARYTVATCV